MHYTRFTSHLPVLFVYLFAILPAHEPASLLLCYPLPCLFRLPPSSASSSPTPLPACPRTSQLASLLPASLPVSPASFICPHRLPLCLPAHGPARPPL
ncbi:hypothetical protein AAFF_G00102130 [Aldrovandia affinis]|uniref:Secreted protein n=1 Tax=Aldrovandia affinis TaxID=143900 RepID=A0AAD7RUP3_9TELE|nr:hypothetical protein AAFF_G00102130 [Aldrovandia affinis]